MRHHQYQVFSDISGKRWKRIKRVAFGLALVVSVVGTLFSFSLLALPISPLPIAEHSILPGVLNREQAARAFLAKRTRARLKAQIDKEAPKKTKPHPRGSAKAPYSTVIAYYVNWQDSCFQSIKDHMNSLTYVMAEWYYLKPNGPNLFSSAFINTKQSNDFQLKALAEHEDVPIIVMLHNIDDSKHNGKWQWEPLKQLLTDKKVQLALSIQLKDELLKNHYAGINIDFEVPIPDLKTPKEQADAKRLMHDNLPVFMTTLKKVFAPAHLLVTQDLPCPTDYNSPFFDYDALNDINDFNVVMLYDQHNASGDAGPIASDDWTEEMAQAIFSKMDSSKVVLGIGAYCLDWPVATDASGNPVEQANGSLKAVGPAKRLGILDAMSLAHDNESPIEMDPDSLNPYLTYVDDRSQERVVYILDAATAYNQLLELKGYEPRGAALWLPGGEDPTIWTFFAEGKLGKPVSASALENMVSTTHEVVTQGNGEIMQVVVGKPSPGKRKLGYDEDGEVNSEQYITYPSTYIVREYGPKWQNIKGVEEPQKIIALTFDDGPDRTNTPQILRVLSHYHVPATFFVVGAQAEKNQGILKLEWTLGNDIGNHTFTHPQIDKVSPQRRELEVNATQRLIESVTGHSTRLFRPPYGDLADTNPNESMIPTLDNMQKMGYLTVGMNIDTLDYENPSVDTIVARVVDHLKDGNVVLMHDGGGVRERTVEALPKIITTLRAKGYRFVTVSELWNEKNGRTEMFPVVGHREQTLAGVDHIIFELGFVTSGVLEGLFLLTLALGVLRLFVTVPFALSHSRQAKKGAMPAYTEPVTVIVPAFNEETVICRTVSSILANDYPDLRVIVVDDGSTDSTYEVASKQFAKDDRVKVVKKPNGGKATALNRGIEYSNTDILVCVDADTVLDKKAIRRLVRQFSDPMVGAVAGNIKVGNRSNPLTIWQSVEYITNQNFDRRAYAFLNSVSVIPGALGAWRRKAIIEAGGYTTDTLAEDADLTFRIRRLGFHMRAENTALAFTEAPDTIAALAKQRFRWAFGILQCLWKHRSVLFRREYGAFGSIVVPAMWTYNVFFQALSPIVDVMALIAVLNFNILPVLMYFAALFVLDFIGALIAFRLDDEKSRQLAWLFWQRFFYRQFMYYVILKSILHALRGGIVGWGKLQRKATAVLPE